MEYVISIIAAISFLLLINNQLRRITIYEYQKGLKYSKGKFAGILETGQYWYIRFWTTIICIDSRSSYVSVPGQEVLTADGVTLKVSVIAMYEIVDPYQAVNQIQDYRDALYSILQVNVREIIGNTSAEQLLQTRNEIDQKLIDGTKEKIKNIGLNLLSINLKDIMFPGQLKQIFAQVVKAKQEGLAALEKARGETAALRNLSNAAKMFESNPNLLQLRLIHALGESGGNTIVFGMNSQQSFVPVQIKPSQDKPGEENPE